MMTLCPDGDGRHFLRLSPVAATAKRVSTFE
jgi:hypothetical protein